MKFAILVLCFFLTAVTNAQTNPDLPNPSMLTKKYLEEISLRKKGQTSFAVKTRHNPRTQQQQQQQSDDERDIQESDVFKLGKKNKKELFLLNNYRGFQVVSFEDGLESPKLVGRFPVFNNWSSEMYYLEKQDQVLILNTEWSYSQNHWQTNYNTSLYLLDVSDSQNPKLVKEMSVPGYLESSRMVGDVLYTITNNGSWDQMKARITSVKISNNAFHSVDNEELTGDKRWVRTMNVLKEGEKYYVISTLSDWSGAGDQVNVHDITSPEGKIEKLLSAKARGQIAERSQTFLHKDHLFIVSNYQENQNSLMRVSVEALPLKKSATVQVSRDNMRLSVGDTNGLHASLQDVRKSGDLLYTFWVPANNIDPFDLFDISEPSKGLKHLGQLQFDGWISKAFPINYKNRKFVLGLGWVIPATSENNRRLPQAKLFEIIQTGNTVKHEVVSSLTLESDEFWASLNDEDKMFEVLEDAPGVYNVLFPVTFTKNWKSGAKIVSVDLNSERLLEGASVIGEQGWLKRVFVNRELRAINTFSDLSLETFSQDDISSGGIAKTVSILELARNIVDFHVLNSSQGVQVINSDKYVEVRVVSLSNVDAEKTDIMGSHSVKGNHRWHKFAGNKLYIITTINKKVKHQEYGYEYEKFDHANLNVLDLVTSQVKVQKIDVTRPAEEQYFYFDLQNISTDKQDIFTVDKDIFKLNGDSLEKLSLDQSCHYFLDSQARNYSLHKVGSEIFAYNSFTVSPVDSGTHAESYSLPFIKKLNLSGAVVDCSPSINVPGRPVLLNNKTLVTGDADQYFSYHRGINYEYAHGDYFPWRRQSGKTYSLRMVSETSARLMDVLNKDITDGVFKKGFVTYSAQETRVDLWSISPKGEFISKPHYLDYRNGKNASLITMRTFNGRDFLFMKNDKKVDLYEMTASDLDKVHVTSTFDQDEEDGSAEYIFAIEGINASKDLSRMFISQGYYGMSELLLK